MRMEIELLVIGNNLPLGGKLVPIALYMLQVEAEYYQMENLMEAIDQDL